VRRDPTPDTLKNEFKEEHTSASPTPTTLSGGRSGMKTDRGKMYIMYGKPDEI